MECSVNIVSVAARSVKQALCFHAAVVFISSTSIWPLLARSFQRGSCSVSGFVRSMLGIGCFSVEVRSQGEINVDGLKLPLLLLLNIAVNPFNGLLCLLSLLCSRGSSNCFGLALLDFVFFFYRLAPLLPSGLLGAYPSVPLSLPSCGLLFGDSLL